MNLKILLFLILSYHSFAGSESTPFSFVISPEVLGSHRFLVMVHDANPANIGGKCLEVQDNGTFKVVWKVDWYAQRGYICLHPDGRSLLRIHDIEGGKPLTKESYENTVAFSFYIEGKLSKIILINEIIKDYTSLQDMLREKRIIKNAVAKEEFSMAEMGFLTYNQEFKENLNNESIFRVATVEGSVFYFTSLGRIVNTLDTAGDFDLKK
jgi:hypothetical protein